ncbi:MAG TPA: HAMP domain-containing histidine kinase, partial [Campylobacterales bacterium]|nr:HAMP domain-containing histidine kinase [Campylobacterales bacterium]
MLSKRSLGSSFFIEIVVVMTAMLIAIMIFISYMLSLYINNNTEKTLLKEAAKIVQYFPYREDLKKDFDFFNPKRVFDIEISIENSENQIPIRRLFRDNNYYLKVTYPYTNSNKVIILTKNISNEKDILINIYLIMLIVTIVGFLFIIYYASKLSKEIMQPLYTITNKFDNMNESLLEPIKTEVLPPEFKQLGDAFNDLINKIKTSINYRKELYVGTAHELKTPLAVMRLKNQITLMKYKRKYNPKELLSDNKETLEQNIKSIDTLNSMIHNILEYGRAEGQQFEKPQRINIIRFLAQKSEEYELLAHSQNRDFIYNFEIERFMINIQPLLFMHIFQNFVQNALKFTPEGGLVKVSVRTNEKSFIVEIIDEGKGIDESENLFAPFKRSTESTGAGLGLFLAQNAAESMGVTISLKNRTDDTQGAIASIIFPFERFLH